MRVICSRTCPEALPGDWIADFLSPPFLPESNKAPRKSNKKKKTNNN